jgi:hypothetical protein
MPKDLVVPVEDETKTVDEWKVAKALTKRQWVWCKAYHAWAEGRLLTEAQFDNAVKTALSSGLR